MFDLLIQTLYVICNVKVQRNNKWKFEVAKNGNTEIKYMYVKIVLKHITWKNDITYIPSLVLRS